jgi:hypothetical protein
MLKNQLLQQALAKVEAGVKNRDAYDKLVSAGTKIIYDKATFQKLSQGIAQSKTPVEDVAKGLVTVINIMLRQARGTAPQDAVAQAGMALLLDALDFMEQAGLVKVDKQVLGQATQTFIEALLPTLGLNPQRLQSALGSVKQTMSDPQKMAQFQSQGVRA